MQRIRHHFGIEADGMTLMFVDWGYDYNIKLLLPSSIPSSNE